ncbi:MAG: hypothetical protein WCK09_21005 [Bacteroidota bacterium]
MKFNTLTVNHLMIKRNLKQKDIASKLSMSEAAFSAAMKRGGISDDRMPILARVLGVDVLDLMQAKDRVGIVSEAHVQYVSAQEKNEIDLLKELLASRNETISNLKRTIIFLEREVKRLGGEI